MGQAAHSTHAGHLSYHLFSSQYSTNESQSVRRVLHALPACLGTAPWITACTQSRPTHPGSNRPGEPRLRRPGTFSHRRFPFHGQHLFPRLGRPCSLFRGRPPYLRRGKWPLEDRSSSVLASNRVHWSHFIFALSLALAPHCFQPVFSLRQSKSHR